MIQTHWERLTCMHGVIEELDYHDCDECKKIAIKEGEEWIDRRQTYIYFKEPKKK